MVVGDGGGGAAELGGGGGGAAELGGGGGAAELGGGGGGAAELGGGGGTPGVEEGVSWQRVQVTIVLVIKLVFTMMEVLPLITVVEVTGQLVRVT